MPTTELADFIAGMPKCELHLHIEGTLEPEQTFALAARNGVEMPFGTPEEFRASYDFDSLASFLTIYYGSMRVLLNEDDFHDLALAYLTKAASQNVRYVEMFFDPQAHTSRGVPFQTVIGGLRRALLSARRDLGIQGELIMCFLRDMSPDYAMATLMESLPYKDWIVGVGLDSDERANPPAKFAAVFARARAEGYHLTMHCDIDQENSIEHIREVLQDIRVDRIDHGTNIVEDPELVALARERGIGFTCCPVSNGFVVDGMKSAEISALLRAGVKVTVNSDDPAYFGAYVQENLLALAQEADLSRTELITLQANAFDIAWLAGSARDRYQAELAAYAAANGA
jgi:adenosine deaminase